MGTQSSFLSLIGRSGALLFGIQCVREIRAGVVKTRTHPTIFLLALEFAPFDASVAAVVFHAGNGVENLEDETDFDLRQDLAKSCLASAAPDE